MSDYGPDSKFGRIRRASAVTPTEDGGAKINLLDMPVNCPRCGKDNFIEDTVSVWVEFDDPPVPGMPGCWSGGVCKSCVKADDYVKDEEEFD
jgi:hypothetical protein